MTPQKINKRTEKKYLKLLHYLYKEKSVPNIISVFRKFNITTTLNSILRDNHYTEKENGKWKWIGRKPDISMAQDILFLCNKKIRSYKRKRNFFTNSSRKYINYSEIYKERSKLIERLNKIDFLIETAKSLGCYAN
jgi:hypothetical protein